MRKSPSHAPARRKGRLWTSTMSRPLPVWLTAVICCGAIASGCALEYLLPQWTGSAASEADGVSDSSICINEVMTGNRSACFTAEGTAADWLELVNTGRESANLRGYSLYTASNAAAFFTFPDLTLAPGECVLVYCDKESKTSGELHAAFSLPVSGTTLVLTDGAGNAVQSLAVPEMDKNRSYSRAEDGSYAVTDSYTPSLPNTPANHTAIAAVRAESPVIVSEVMAKNATYQAPDGSYPDYIELTNTSSSDVDLSGWHLSDSRDNPTKWTFPSVTIPGNGTLVVWCTGVSGNENGALRCDFMLQSDGECAVLANPAGQIASDTAYPALACDQAWSLLSGAWTDQLAPTPGYRNSYENAALTDAAFTAANTEGVTISEIMTSTDKAETDWLELFNATGSAVDLSGWGLSDKAGAPLKWTFPEGSVIEAGQYLVLLLSGAEGVAESGHQNVPFRLAADGGYTLTLATPDGTVCDRMYVPEQCRNISYGRAGGKLLYFDAETLASANDESGFPGRAQMPAISCESGLYKSGDTVTVEIAAAPGQTVYYTLDAGDPTPETGTLYTEPITISSTAILRVQAYRDGRMPSRINSRSYLFDAVGGVRVISLVADPDDLFGSAGIYTNYEEEVEIEGYADGFDPEGGAMFSQGCGVSISGKASRRRDQKAFKIVARAAYGASSFEYPLFSRREWTSYSSFLIRSAGQDTDSARLRDPVLSKLAQDTGLLYMESEVCVLYLNGAYWGQYYIRERIDIASVCRDNGWMGQEDDIDFVKFNRTTVQGSNDSFAALEEYVESHDMTADEDYEMIDSVIDVENFIDYMAIQMFTGNYDTLNVKRYRNPGENGKWKWILYDLDLAFTVDTNSISRWLAPGGMGNDNLTDNTLFIGCMKNPTFRDKFLTRMGERMAGEFSTQSITAMFEAQYREIEPLLPAQLERWNRTEDEYAGDIRYLLSYAKSRPGLLLGYFQKALDLTAADMEHYFGAAMEQAGYTP